MHKKRAFARFLRLKHMGLASDLALTDNEVLVRGQFRQSHWTSSMQLLRADANFRTKTELKTIGKTSRCVHVNCSRVNHRLEALSIFWILCDNTFRVFRPILSDVC